MRLARVALKGLIHYRSQVVPAMAGVAVSAAVITGSLLAGGSVQETVRRRAFGRLGRITHVITAPAPMTVRLAARLQQARGIRTAVPLLRLDATVSNPETDAAAPRVQLLGVPPAFMRMYSSERLPAPRGRQALISEALARDLGIRRGDGLIVTIARPEAAVGRSLFTRPLLSERMLTFRLECAGVGTQDGPCGFSLDVESGARRTVLVDYDWLAEQAGLQGRAHAIVVDADGASPQAVEQEISPLLEPDDLNLRLDIQAGQAVLRSRSVTVPEPLAGGLRRALERTSKRVAEASIMLLTSVSVQGKARKAHYIVAAASSDVSVRDDGIVLSQWLRDDIQAAVGDRVLVTWLEPSEDGSYPERRTVLRVERIVPVEEAAQAQWLVPDFAGITDARRISDWNPPFPVNLRLVTPRDEQYWEKYRAAPRAFLSAATVRRMWAPSSEWVTALRADFGGQVPPTQVRAAVLSAIRSDGGVRQYGPRVRDLRAEAATASQGSSDFRGLMLGMCVFLIASALGLTAGLLQLSAYRRAAQTGLLLAVGFGAARASAVLALEGVLASVVAAAVGSPAGVMVAAGMVHALNRWWSGAVAGEPITLSVHMEELAVGAATAAVLGSVVSWWVAWRLARRDVRVLLSGWRALQVEDATIALRAHSPTATAAVRGRLLRLLIWPVLALACAAAVARVGATPTGYMVLGALLLLIGLGALYSALSLILESSAAPPTIARTALRNAGLHRQHSVLVAAIVAAAAFLVVTVAANIRSTSTIEVRDRASGSGGFDLLVRTTVPLPVSLDTPAGRKKLGFAPEDEALFQHAEVQSLLASDGVSVGCLNLARPTEPRVLGVPQRMIERGGFTIQTRGQPPSNPWRLLTGHADEATVPAFGDSESVRWILHSGLGQTVQRSTEVGRVSLRFAGLVRFSIFAGELLISEEHFRRLFPSVSSPSVFLIRAARPDDVGPLAQAIRRTLGEAGVEVRRTQEVLAELMEVQNAYLSAFLVLGGLGIMLGMAGVGALLMRTAAERRGELAILLAMGFTRRHVVRLLLMESMGLLLYGAMLGTAAALVGSVPRVVSGEAAVNWPVTVAILVGAMAAGALSCLAAARSTAALEVYDALRQE